MSDATKYHGIALPMVDRLVPGVDYSVFSPADLYMLWAKQLFELRARPDYTDEQEDEILDAMDPVWWAMSEEEQQRVGDALDKLDAEIQKKETP